MPLILHRDGGPVAVVAASLAHLGLLSSTRDGHGRARWFFARSSQCRPFFRSSSQSHFHATWSPSPRVDHVWYCPRVACVASSPSGNRLMFPMLVLRSFVVLLARTCVIPNLPSCYVVAATACRPRAVLLSGGVCRLFSEWRPPHVRHARSSPFCRPFCSCLCRPGYCRPGPLILYICVMGFNGVRNTSI